MSSTEKTCYILGKRKSFITQSIRFATSCVGNLLENLIYLGTESKDLLICTVQIVVRGIRGSFVGNFDVLQHMLPLLLVKGIVDSGLELMWSRLGFVVVA